MPFSNDWKDEMSDNRRIKTVDAAPSNLKEIGGRLQKLSYREMQTLAFMLSSDMGGATTEGFASALLKVADQLLSR